MPLLTILAILALATLLTVIAMRGEGLALFAPGKSARITGAAQQFCLDQCQHTDGSCPLGDQAKACPLWGFVRADLNTGVAVDPLRAVGTP
jgi:hypothetical protein